MGDLFAILTQGGNSLAAHRAASATASHNIQNANTPGFARQRAELTAVTPGDDIGHGQVGRGVSLLNITQARDKFIEAQLPTAFGNHANSAAQAETLEAVTTLDPNAENGLAANLGKLYATMRQLSQNPGDRGLRQAVIAAGQGLTLAFNQADASITTAKRGAEAKLVDVLGDANRAAANIAELNRQIRQGSATSSPNDLMDARQKNMDKLGELTGAYAVSSGNNVISMMLPGGTPLVSEFSGAVLTAVGNATTGNLDVMVQPPGATMTKLLPSEHFNGSVGGLLDARDLGLEAARNELDQLAFDFTNAFNAIHTAGYGLDGANGRLFFTQIGNPDGAARAFSVDAGVAANVDHVAASSTAAGAPGDGINLLALIASEDLDLPGGANVGETLGRVIANYGSIAGQARARNDQDTTALESLKDLREGISGVSIDEELVNLTKSQRAFEAVMKVITTSDEMLETLMQLR
jgi:flagellar hook-associated protein 1 FlgK